MNESLVNIEKKALEWLKLNLKKQKLVHKKSDIDTEIILYLYSRKFIGEINKQYIFLKHSDELEFKALKANFWLIVVEFLNIAFPEGWCCTGAYAYKLLLEDFSINLKQISISTQAKSNRIIKLTEDFEIYASYDKNFTEKPLIKKTLFLKPVFLLRPEYLIIHATLSDYKNYKNELISFIRDSDRDEEYILNYFKKQRSDVLLARLIGALRALGDFTIRLELEELYKIYKVTVPVKNPFEDYLLPLSLERPAYINRFEISLLKAIKYLQAIKKPVKLKKKLTAKDIDGVSTEDTYHSLTIEGYTVTQSLIRFLETHEPSHKYEATLKDQLAAKGFMNTLDYIKKLNDAKFTISETLARKLFEELWKPSLNAKLRKESMVQRTVSRLRRTNDRNVLRVHEDHEDNENAENVAVACSSRRDVYRKHLVSIKGSMYVPPNYEKIPFLLNELFKYTKDLDNGFLLGIFLHYFYVSIHPHSDGNGRISRFLMNIAFINDSYNWLTIKSERRNDYFKALERSQLEDDISYFVEFIISEIK
jgi:Fic family protein